MRSIIFGKLLVVLFLCVSIIFLDSCADKVAGPGEPNEPQVTDSVFIPLDCPSWQKYERTGSNLIEYKAIQPWFHAVTSDPNAEPNSLGSVEIKPFSTKLIEVSPQGKETVIACLADEYGTTPERALETNEGGLFSRWYPADNIFEPLANSVYNYSANSLKISVGLYPKKISHWWFNPWEKYPKLDDCSYLIETEVRIIGDACFQIAADFYKTTTSNYPDNKEAGQSVWFASTNGWKKIRFKVCSGA